jgi:hypothetical protein
VTADLALTALERFLVEERDAVIRLDATNVVRIAEEKESLIAVLRDGLPTLGEAHRPRLRDLRDALRHNTVLLAHARDLLRDALAAFHIEESTGGGLPRSTPRPGARISIRG